MVVASDLEGTLTTGETWKGLARYLTRHGHAWPYRRFFAVRMPGYALTKLRVRDYQSFRERWIAQMPRLLAGFSTAHVDEIAAWVVENELWPKRRPAVVAELEAHRQSGRRVVLVSATYQPVLDAFAAKLGVEAVGTPLEVVEGILTGHTLCGVNSGGNKPLRLADSLNLSHLEVAYGDTAADIPFLELSRAPVAVCPDRDLRAHAEHYGWRVIQLR